MLETSDIKNKEWLSEDLVCDLLEIRSETLRKKCRKAEFTYQIQKSGNKNIYLISKKSLPQNIQDKINFDFDNVEDKYSNAPIWAKFQADKYILIIKAAEDRKGLDLRQFIEDWNITNPEYKTSYSSLMLMKKRYKEFGFDGLLAQYGKTRRTAPIQYKYYDYFKNLYLVEGSPSLQSCWDSTLGYAMRTDGISKSNFPSRMAF